MRNLYTVFAFLLSILLPATAFSAESDTRQALELNNIQRHHLLTEMRQLLQGTQAIVQALSENDMSAVRKRALSLGTGMPHKGEDHLHTVLPKAFMAMGMQVHQGFDKLAQEAESAQNSQIALKQLSEIMQTCNSCHATYQIQVKTAKK